MTPDARCVPPSQPLILVVDDSPTSIELLLHFLSGQYRVIMAINGPAALDLAEGQDRPDLILLDVMMPGMDGYEVCRRLKENPATREIPVIFITALDSVSDQVRGLELGAVDYLNKSLVLDVVRARIALHLRLCQQQQELDRYRLALEELVAERTGELAEANQHLGETLFAMDRAGIAIHWVDAESGRFLYVNEATCEMTGYSKAELLSMVVSDLDPNVPGEGFVEHARLFIGRQGPIRIESVHRLKDGRIIPVEVMLHYRDQQPGVPGRFIAFVLDIAERKQAEQKLCEEKERAQRYLDTVQTIMLALDRDGNISMINRAGCALLGYEEQELLGRSWFATCLPQPEGMDRVYPVFQRIMNGALDTVEYFENAVRCKNGQERLAAWHNNYFLDENGSITGTLCSGEDITERRQAELAADQTRQLLQEAVDSLSQGIAVYDRDDRLMICNEAYRQLYALSRDLIATGARFEDIVRVGARRGQYPEAVGRVDDWVRERMALHQQADGAPFEQQIEDGLWLQIAESRTASGYLVGSRTDITGLKRGTEELLQHRQELERKVERRTEQLRHLAKEATLAEERERQAIARDLHDDLGQMLHVVRIKLDSMMMSAAPEACNALRDLTSLVAEASRMVRSLISQLSPPILAELGLVPAIDWLAEEMEANYGLMVEVEHDGMAISLSPAKAAILFRVVRELLINVAKHAVVRRARVVIRLIADQLALVVADEGVGMASPEEALMGRKGFGLGSVRERIAYLGGTMEIHTVPGRGTSVVLMMPIDATTDHDTEVVA